VVLPDFGDLSSRVCYRYYDSGVLFRRERKVWGLPGINVKMFERNFAITIYSLV